MGSSEIKLKPVAQYIGTVEEVRVDESGYLQATLSKYDTFELQLKRLGRVNNNRLNLASKFRITVEEVIDET